MVSKCPGDRTAPNDAEVNWRVGDPRKLYFSLDLKLFSDLELLFQTWSFWEHGFGVAQILDQGPELLDQGPELLNQNPETS